MNNTSKFATTAVHLTILDINDNQPVFDPNYYAENISEDESIGHTVLTVSATDADHVSIAWSYRVQLIIMCCTGNKC